MSDLFYKDLQSHQASYREVRADEAVNDLLLGAKLNTLNSLEDAKNNLVDEIAINYGKFLKALKTKNLPLLNRSTDEENRIIEAAKASQASQVGTVANRSNILMPSYGSESETGSLSEPASSVIARLSADLTPEQQKINEAYNISTTEKNIPSMIKRIKQALGGTDSAMVKNFEFIMHENGYSAASTKKKMGTKSPTGDAVRSVMGAMQQQYFKPVR